MPSPFPYKSPKRQPSVPKTATLFVHYLANIIEEIVFKSLGSTLDGIAIEVLLLEYLINVCAVAMHLLGEPADSSALLVENPLDDMSYMKICHPSVYKVIS